MIRVMTGFYNLEGLDPRICNKWLRLLGDTEFVKVASGLHTKTNFSSVHFDLDIENGDDPC